MASTEMEMGGNSNGGSSSEKLVVTELSHIKELVTQLEVHLGGSPSPDLCKHLASQIFSLTERSISLLITDAAARRAKRSAADAGLASPLSAATPTPTSDVTDGGGPFKKTTKKRKVMEQRRQRVSSAGGETPVDDGHSWRKYGQKEILGAKHPRGYYRCTHRHSQGCTATKQVQRTDEDPKMYDVIYHGEHTCVHRAPATAAEHNPEAHGHLQSLSAGLTVKTEDLLPDPQPQGCWSAAAGVTPLYVTPPASGGGGCQLAPSTASDNWGVSPATSNSKDHVASYLAFDDAVQWRGHAELQEVVSALVAASAPPPPPPMPPTVDSLDVDALLIDIDIDIASFLA